jgi:hypothetical protein
MLGRSEYAWIELELDFDQSVSKAISPAPKIN